MKTQTNFFFASFFTWKVFSRTALACLLGLMFFSAAAGFWPVPALASAGSGTIAYVRPNPDTGDEIHLIKPDGSNDRLLWRTNLQNTVGLPQITAMAWHPAATELAFASTHEEACSMYQADIYVLRSDGQDYRRVTQPPACGHASHLPTGTVRVPVENWTDESGPFTFYLEGAPGPIEMAIAPGGSTMLTFNNVADYGNYMQSTVAIYGEVRSYDLDSDVDVKAGSTVQTGVLTIGTGFNHLGSQWPTYRTDGSKIASIFNKGDLYQVDANNREIGIFGSRLPVSMPMSSDFLTWGPTAARANQFLYEGWQDSDTIFLGDANSGSSQLLVTIDPTRIGRMLLGLAWLPDGSGFLYSYNELVNWVDKADLFVYSFATGQSTRLTNVPSGFIRRITVSPDGQKIVYEYQTTGYWTDENPATDLWIMNRNGSQAALFVENARAPVWSKVDAPEPLVFNHHVFMPMVRK